MSKPVLEPIGREGEIASVPGDVQHTIREDTRDLPGTAPSLNGLVVAILALLLGILSGSLVVGGALLLLLFR